MSGEPSDTYESKKRRFGNMLTLYGRKPVLEVLQIPTLEVFRLHLAKTNHSAQVMQEIESLATERNIEIRMHTRVELSRISKNGRQDQGVAIDLIAPDYCALEDLPVDTITPGFEILLLDRITNPQNLGMIIRSVAASPINGMILPRSGSAAIDPLVFKASAGTLFNAPIFHCQSTQSAIKFLKDTGIRICGLDGKGKIDLADLQQDQPQAIVLGNESTGLSTEVKQACDLLIKIPMANQVESLNVSAAATLVAFRRII
jgi:23S rRNA (guanosine2251-2'-O)-methyltransferase